MNHSAKLKGAETSAKSALTCTPGGVTPGGKQTHAFDPTVTAFQAEVELGSQCHVEPDREGPAIWKSRKNPRLVRHHGS